MKNRVQAVREAMGLTQDDFAEKVGVTKRAVQHWEGRTRSPSPLAMRRLREVYTEHAQKTKGASARSTTTDSKDGDTKTAVDDALDGPVRRGFLPSLS